MVQTLQDLKRKRNKKADPFSVTTLDSEPSPTGPVTPVGIAEQESQVNRSRVEPIPAPPHTSVVPVEECESTPEGDDPPTPAVLVVQLDSKDGPTSADFPVIQGEPPFQRFLGHLHEKGVARKFYVATTLENEFVHEALLDTASDITLMSSGLFNQRFTDLPLPHDRDAQCYRLDAKIRAYNGPLNLQAIAEASEEPEPPVNVAYATSWPLNTALEQRHTFLCALAQSPESSNHYCPQVVNGIQLEGAHVRDTVLALWADKSSVSKELFDSLQSTNPELCFVNTSHCFPLDPGPKAVLAADGICALTLSWNRKSLTHFMLVVPNLPHAAYIGSDVLVRIDLTDDKQLTLQTVTVMSLESQPPSAPQKPQALSQVELVYSPVATQEHPIRTLDHTSPGGAPQEQATQALKSKLSTAPCLSYPDCNKEFHLKVGFSNYCLSAGLYQVHDQDKRVVAYASKTIQAPELKYNNCEKALLATVWAAKHFSNYLGCQRVVVETHHQPVTFNSQRIRDGIVTNARVASWLMALQSFDIVVRYAKNETFP
ncbi:hypothetical protein NFI96_005790 [Prochilodus magdalenae]|nr:hypothetical protein NFI96_005790 [Prochilodus magdalenae]